MATDPRRGTPRDGRGSREGECTVRPYLAAGRIGAIFAAPTDQRGPTMNAPTITAASVARRFVAYCADSLIAGALAFAFGARTTPSPAMWAAVAFLLVRDATGASPGKMLLGLRVVRSNDHARPATILQRLGRNVVVAAAAAQATVIPVAGMSVIWLLPLVAGIALVIDGAWLYETGERLSDRIVGTAVVRVTGGPSATTSANIGGH
jgi:uncharacterized RDD family membrane protein YckC